MSRTTRTATIALLAAAGLGVGLPAIVPPEVAGRLHAAYAIADGELASDELLVTLAPGSGERLLKVVDIVMGSETIRSLGHDRFLVRQGPSGQRDDWAAFFAALPYVKEVKPKPTRKPSEQMPKGKLHLVPPQAGDEAAPAGGPGDAEAAAPGREYVPGEVLVKFKRGTTQKQIDQFMRESGTQILGRLDLGEERIYRLQVPEGVEVPDLASQFSESSIVEYAEPNYKMSIPKLPGAKKPPAKGTPPTPPKMPAVPGALSIDTGDLLGDSVFITFRPGVREPVPDLVALVFGVGIVEGDNARVRYSLPKGINPLTASRIFKLCPYVMGAEPSYGR